MARKENPEHLTVEEAAAGKGRPTPKRREQEAAQRRALIADPKSGAKERRARIREQRAKEQQAMLTGDERHMPVEHRGPVRKYIRDYIDARTSLGEFALPGSIAFVVASLFFNSNPTVGGIIIFGFYALVFAAIGDTLWAMRAMRRRITEKFGADALGRGWRLYSAARLMNLRRLRVPRPVVKRGEYPV
ncbi:DUF3043 domain-containing protein [Demequina sp. TTPB684]|uniref:DUF3043 domain-containing protein n=1 Tax=unclassified Demequina TaxID=2620311 RepID=UPI001CF5E11B|nr:MULTISPECIES: DUF3043 domain-containing protein [unclassified Demequina]MCB2413819.1 DUF3043 domain-containing protein [Demequina sp. TTPB684]UPU89132.1 DUF3043 domain-containing protein [Demequina sp. TMPB413]